MISPYVMVRLGGHFTAGASKYGDRNWEKGQTFEHVNSSFLRHYNAWLMGETDEDHLIAALWNLHALVHFEEMIKRGKLDPALNDLPFTNKELT